MKLIIQNCLKCSTEYNAWSKYGLKKFCSRSCANSRNMSVETRLKISHGVKNSDKFKAKYQDSKVSKSCPMCLKQFVVKKSNSNKIYCSKDCYKKDSPPIYRKKPPGGYREGSGRAKTGYYNGIYCGSTYELCWVIYNIDHNIKFSRFEGHLKNSTTIYYPDFLLDDNKTIVEIKGYELADSIERKTKLAESFGYTVKVLYKKDLAYTFEYVKTKFKTNKFFTLYDNYRPSYTYVCACCMQEFTKDYKLKTTTVFCSQQCSGKGHKGRKYKTLP